MDIGAMTDRQRHALRSRSTSHLEALGALLQHPRHVDANEVLVTEGSAPNRVYQVSEGWAIRYKTLPDGRRQILDFLLPGDTTGLFSVLFDQSCCGVQALTPLLVRSAGARRLVSEFNRSQQMAVTLSWLAGCHARRSDEQILRIGRRNAEERMAHLFLELYRRLRRSGLQDTVARRLPITQKTIADHIGMSQVHANRTFRALVRHGVVALRDGNVLLLDPHELVRLADFEDDFLEHTPLFPTSQASFCA
jgi:CRP-like cAMP-binding protein